MEQRRPLYDVEFPESPFSVSRADPSAAARCGARNIVNCSNYGQSEGWGMIWGAYISSAWCSTVLGVACT